MDQRVGEKEERNSEDSSGHRRKDDVDAAAEGMAGMNNHGESMDHQRDGGYEAEEITAGVLKEVEVEVVGGSEEASASPLVTHPCSLLQLLLRACAGCLGLRGYCNDDDDPKPAAATGTDDVAAPGAVAAAVKSPQEGDRQGDGDKAASVSVRDHRLICRYTVTGRSSLTSSLVQICNLVHAGGGHSGVGSEEEAVAARPSDRRFRWQWREPPLVGNGSSLAFVLRLADVWAASFGGGQVTNIYVHLYLFQVRT